MAAIDSLHRTPLSQRYVSKSSGAGHWLAVIGVVAVVAGIATIIAYSL